MRLALSGVFLCLLVRAAAAQDAAPQNLETIPGPERVESEDALEAEVTIIQREEETVEEYRVNGRLYMVRIIPRKGRPYYLVDTDGDGSLDARRDTMEPGVVVPQWVIFSW